MKSGMIKRLKITSVTKLPEIQSIIYDIISGNFVTIDNQ